MAECLVLVGAQAPSKSRSRSRGDLLQGKLNEAMSGLQERWQCSEDLANEDLAA